ncbi:Probable poly(ADP-ribose) glycohydrolase 2 [Geodia barretti]|uniref:Probable poly(ADP-ribose) glycohydrolase 2 n=1 Tax=Geodia barretti TaxID=519541 RepID=A0AA35RTW5_GEOBA|nr:Probable poly(ADP-ribose) glycohydrolase 2 [Geodia barretti]
MADNVLSSIFSGPEAPQAVVKKAIESGQSSQSSSVTGQTITLHEFTDDLVEGVMREGLLIARLQARATGRESDFVGCEGGKEGGLEVGGEAGNSVRGASEVAELLVSRLIQNVLEDARKSRKEETVGERDKNGGLRPFSWVRGGASRTSESPMRSSESPMMSSLKAVLLRQTLEKPKQPNLPHDSETHDIEQSTSSSLLHLTAPSSRMSYAWSVASTRDEGSRPVSPSDLDRLALSFVCNIEEYCSMFAELVIRGAIAQVTGNKKYMCHVPVKSYHSSRESLSVASGDLRMSVPSVRLPPSLGEVEGESHTLTPSRLDTFLSNLSEAEPVSGDVEEGEGGFQLRSTAVDQALLRKVATGNWGCGKLGGDPQLKSMLQWAAVSASGRSEMIYFPSQDQRMKELVNVIAHIRAKQWKVGQLVSALVDYCHLSSEDRNSKQLFSFLLHN